MVSNLYTLTWLTLAFLRAAIYFRWQAVHDLRLPPSIVLDSKAMRRLQHYFYGTTFLSIVFGLLHRRRRTSREKYLFSNLAALSYYFDDLADAYRREDNGDHPWLDNPEDYGRRADPNGLALHLLDNLYRNLPPQNLDAFKRYLHRVFNVETANRPPADSRQPTTDNRRPTADNPQPTADYRLPTTDSRQPIADGLWRVTREKGGASVLLFRRILDAPLYPGEEDALYAFGGLVQLCDDVTDLWFDHRDGTQTVPLHYAVRHDVAGMRAAFEGEVARVQNLFVQIKQAPGVHSAWSAACILVGIARVCIDHYAKIQQKSGTLPLHDRALMVVDMERWGNRLRLVRRLLTDLP
ncbi:MAG: hypothetical protein SFV52_01080 [Saprospiraceae bacterium]|nr:hypothetical protein [Saprospiraceae bacterium]